MSWVHNKEDAGRPDAFLAGAKRWCVIPRHKAEFTASVYTGSEGELQSESRLHSALRGAIVRLTKVGRQTGSQVGQSTKSSGDTTSPGRLSENAIWVKYVLTLCF